MNQGREEVSVTLEHEQADAPVDVNERRDERVVVSNAPAIETHDRVLEHDRDNEDNDDEDVALVSMVTRGARSAAPRPVARPPLNRAAPMARRTLQPQVLNSEDAQ